ncbi:Ferredoxin-1 [Tetrabaena socialis]|uniref:Ferredoxin n=1 Tax=Tetrabaena socialis TaxID=47790 RepID=A0A2J8ABJ1_9CHLO|nr:Ferredoxin-1 [Tetrabaena socialis]|eukprot:PNH09867.1 Ferredoxin-1 [Tetrabaena socialis]
MLSSRVGALQRAAYKPCRASRTTLKVQAFQVTLRAPSGKTYATLECRPDEAIFDAIERNNVDLPSLCRSGACGTCAGRVQTGSVEMQGTTILDPDQIAGGYVLLCAAYPRSDCTILTHQEERLHTSDYGKK